MRAELTKRIVLFVAGILIGFLGAHFLKPQRPNPRFTLIRDGAMFDQLTGRACLSVGDGSPSMPACRDLLQKH